MDDQWAIAHLCLHPRIKLLGIVTTHTPYQTAQRSAQVAQEVLRSLPLQEHPPVVPASSAPLPDREHPHRNAGVDFIVETIRQHRGAERLTVLTIGAATDLASALMIAPDIAERIQLVSMAFYDLERAGHEFNVENDPLAWQILLEAPIPVTIGSASVCLRDLLMTVPKARALLGECGEGGEYLIGLLEWWLNTQPETVRNVTGRTDAWPVWDECVTAHLLGWTQVRTVNRPRLLDNLLFDLSPNPFHPFPQIRWIERVDADSLWHNLSELLKGAMAASP